MEKLFCLKLLIGEERVKRLQNSFVIVIGLGAVGSYATEALARSGIGKIRLVDFDKIKASNFNRHLLAIDSNLGKPKVEVAKARIAEINPACQVEARQIFAADETMDEVLSGGPDLVVDAVDSFNPKTQILAACHQKKIHVISSMGAALRTDILSVKTADISKTSGCPLAREVRHKLRKQGIRRGIFCVYSDERVVKPADCQEPRINEEDEYLRGRKRRKLGSLPTVTGVFGLVVAHYAISFLIKDLKSD